MSRRIKKYYMHTINGLPAFFSGDQICYAGNNHEARKYNILAKPLYQIKKEQRKSAQYRKANGLDNEAALDYIIVYTPD